jgi:membrane-associated phospholipid phosphatase
LTLRTEKALVAVVLPSILAPAFFLLAKATAAHIIPPPGWLITPLDGALPVIPAAVWLYASWYPATAIPALADRHTFRRACAAYAVALLICSFGYLALPVAIERPLLPSNADLSTYVLRNLYDFDPPVNLFPSYHAALAVVLCRTSSRSVSPWIACRLWAVSVCVACILTKEHYVLDVASGVAVGYFATTIVDFVGARLYSRHLQLATATGTVNTVPASVDGEHI